MSNYQEDVKAVEKLISQKTDKSTESPYFLLTNLSSEVGELCDEIIGLEGERIEDKEYDNKDEAAKEIIDVVFNALRIANHYNLDLDKYWSKRMQSLREKFQ